jgi:hypothetical protein
LPDRWRAPSGDATRPRSHPGWRGLKIKEQVRGLLAEGYEVYTVDDVRVEHEADEHVWNAAKGHISNLQRDTPEETFSAFMSYVTSCEIQL